MVAREDWVRVGLGVLAREGAPGVTIERLTGELGVSKGSFYHHFKGAGGFKTALLEYFETQNTRRLMDAVEEDPTAAGVVKLHRLLELILDDSRGYDLEIAIRAWALQDDEVRAAQERVDRTRTDYLEGLCREILKDRRSQRESQRESPKGREREKERESRKDRESAAGVETGEAAHLARLLYLILIGAGQVVPGVPRDELRAIYAMTLRLSIGETAL
ncbi:TetR/AcrR family transcriptional regulator [Kribbella sp. NBC_01245]|uniref:TetR/AcrR family transcriptional regulator n=1 Tax=Kribbella sp. NBC_01245 TaxID=2903578 RepID=UPI002E2E1924|nr:TetR/AcrR family transcriptional regulator [Kribbella sp. NBC_01245]